MPEENKEKPKANVFVDREIQTTEKNSEYKSRDSIGSKKIRLTGRSP